MSIPSPSSPKSFTSYVTLDKLLNYVFLRFIEMILIIIILASLGVPSVCSFISLGISLVWLTAFPLHFHYCGHHISLSTWVTAPLSQIYLHISLDIAYFSLGMVELYNFKLFVNLLRVYYICLTLLYILTNLKNILDFTRVSLPQVFFLLKSILLLLESKT